MSPGPPPVDGPRREPYPRETRGEPMGKEVVYCFNCGVRLLYSDFEKGAAFRAGQEFACSECMPLLLEMLPPEEREAFLKKATGQEALPSATPRRGTGRVPLADGALRKSATTRRTAPAAVEEEEEEAEGADLLRRRRRILWISAVAALALLTVPGLLLLLRRKAPRPLPPEETPAPPAAAPAPPPPKTPEEIAREMLERARRYGTQNPSDLEGQIRELQEVAFQYENTPAAVEALREAEALRRKIAEGLTPEMEKLLEEIREPLRNEDYRKVLETLDRAKERNPRPAWILQVDKRIDEVKTEAERNFDEVKRRAAEARDRKDSEELARLRRRVEGWGIDRYREEFETLAGPAAAEPGPAPPPARTEEGKAYLDQWRAAMIPASGRDYAEALRRLEEVSRGLREAPWRKEAQEDLRDLRAVESLVKTALQAASRIPPGTRLSLEVIGTSGGKETVTGTVLDADAEHLEIRREGGKDIVFVDPADLTAPSLAMLARRAGRDKPGDLRTEALFLLLEGEAEEARKREAGTLPQKYWDYAGEASGHRSRAGSAEARREREAKILLWSAARDYAKMETFGNAIEKYKILARDYVDTSVVSRDIKRITLRSEAGKEYFFLAGDLRGSGAVKLRPHPELGSCWTCQEDVTSPQQARETYVEIEFWALPDTPYQCWLFAGACCLETFVLYLQATDLAGPNPAKRSEKIPYDVGGGVALPLEPRVPGLKKTHSQHGGEKQPAKWEWIPIPLPKYASGGLKKVRCMTENKGFSVAMALVSSLRKAPPKDEELGEERRRAAEEAAARRRPEPGLVALWTFDEQTGRTVEDRSGRGHAGKIHGNPQPSPHTSPSIASGNNGSLRLDSKKDFIQVPSSPALELGTSSFTVSAWVCLTDAEPSRLLNKWDGKTGWILDLNTDAGGKKAKDRIRARLSDGQTEIDHVVPARLDTKGKRWSHVAMVVDRDARELRLYVDGQMAGGAKPLGDLKDLGNQEPIGIGVIPSKKDNYFGGFLDEIRIYARALSASEVADLMHQPAGR